MSVENAHPFPEPDVLERMITAVTHLIGRLIDTLPPSLRNFPGLLREEPLARPSGSATVEYLRSRAEVVKGGVA